MSGAAALGITALLAVWMVRIARRTEAARRVPSAWIHAAAIGVYCTSWTYFGAIGTAARSGWAYLPIYVGPLLVLIFARGLLERLARAAHAGGTRSIADFLAARFGKAQSVAAIAAIAALMAVVPYMALQLRAVATGFAALSGSASGGVNAATVEAGSPLTLLVAAALSGFVIVFSARFPEANRRNPGLVTALAAESVFKVLAFILVAVISCLGLALFVQTDTASIARGREALATSFAPSTLTWDFAVLTTLSAAAFLCLPRQFYVGLAEARPGERFRTARWVVGGYLLAFSALAPLLAFVGLAMLGPAANADLFIITAPLEMGLTPLAVLAFVGGVAAATGMAIAAAATMATMIANHLVMPVLLRGRRNHLGEQALQLRRASVIALFAIAVAFEAVMPRGAALADIGLLAFGAVVQLAPAMISSVTWRGAHRVGVTAGIAAGLIAWAIVVAAPVLTGTPDLAGPAAGFGLSPFSFGVVISLGVNILALIVGSAFAVPSMRDRLQACAFCDAPGAHGTSRGSLAEDACVGDVRALLTRTLSARDAAAVLDDARDDEPADEDLANRAETRIARVLGSASARLIVDGALRAGPLGLQQALELADDVSAQKSFSRDLLQAALENISQGVSVVDRDLRLVAWNQNYLSMFAYPPGLVQVGRPVEDLLRYNRRRGLFGSRNSEADIQARLAHLKTGEPHTVERVWTDGRVILIQGRPMPDGGYVTSFTDVTEDRRKTAELREAKEGLEARVAERTGELEAANANLMAEHERSIALAADLAQAKAQADKANAAKTRFLAAASHDLLQPLNAARLFATSLGEDLRDGDERQRQLVEDIERSIRSADRLLRALLDVSKLDSGKLTPRLSRFALQDVLDDLATEFAGRAEAKGLKLRIRPTACWVESDRGLLFSLLQNLVSNAVRYTEKGGVLIGVRQRGGRCSVEIWDTGPGIPISERTRIFEEFRRLKGRGSQDERGLGLGLALVERLSGLLDHPVSLNSQEGSGSVFRVNLPQAEAAPRLRRGHVSRAGPSALQGLKVVVLDDDADVRRATAALLSKWGCVVEQGVGAGELTAAFMASGGPDVVILDHDLGDDTTGAEALAKYIHVWGRTPATVMISAERMGEAQAAARDLGAHFLAKPVEPAKLRALLSRLAQNRASRTAIEAAA